MKTRMQTNKSKMKRVTCPKEGSGSEEDESGMSVEMKAGSDDGVANQAGLGHRWRRYR
jgi:hypothetical protein